MQLLKQLLAFGEQAIPRQVLLSLLSDYKRPNDKISDWCTHKILLPLKRGLFVLHPEFLGHKPNMMHLANVLYGPSYMSLDYALAYHGAIPEQSKTITSVCIKVGKTIQTPLAKFSYLHLPLPYYSLGIKNIELSKNDYVLIASPEKALCDKVILTRSLQLRSVKETIEFFTENLRIDENWLKKLDLKLIESFVPFSPKKSSLEIIIKTLNAL